MELLAAMAFSLGTVTLTSLIKVRVRQLANQYAS